MGECPFSDVCAAAGPGCSCQHLEEYCRPIFKPEYQKDASFIEWRRLIQYGLSGKIDEIQSRGVS